MLGTTTLVRRVRPGLERNPRLHALAKETDVRLTRMHHSVASWVPNVIRPKPRQMTVAITSYCNLHCIGCNYGSNSFMPGQALSLEIVRDAVSDAREAGVDT